MGSGVGDGVGTGVGVGDGLEDEVGVGVGAGSAALDSAMYRTPPMAAAQSRKVSVRATSFFVLIVIIRSAAGRGKVEKGRGGRPADKEIVIVIVRRVCAATAKIITFLPCRVKACLSRFGRRDILS